jgi:hypothetical protein
MIDTRDKRKDIALVRSIMRKSGWITITDLYAMVSLANRPMEPQSVSARIRDLRKDEFGGHDVRRRYSGVPGVWEYKLFPTRR